MSEKIYNIDDYIPIELFGKDHWSTLAYVETVMTDIGGFQIGRDPKMRSNRRNFRVMAEECPSPYRAVNKVSHPGVVMQDHHSTILKNGQVVKGHDDWSCLQDLANAAFFDTNAYDIQPDTVIKLSTYGRTIANQLREFKSNGGSFKEFQIIGKTQ